MNTQASNLPKRVEDLVKEITEKSPGYSEAQVWATAWSIYCKHIKPGDAHCSMGPEGYLVKKALDRLVARTAASGAAFITPKTQALAKYAYGLIKTLKASWGTEVDLPSNAGGFIIQLLEAKGERSAASQLHQFFGNMHGLGTGFGLDSPLASAAHSLASKVNLAEAVAIGILLLRAVKRPRAAVAFEAWADKHLDLAAFDATDPALATEKVLSPGDAFEATITPEVKGLVAWAWPKIGRTPADAETFAAGVATDANWHSLRAISEQPNTASPNWEGVSMVSSTLRYNLPDIAAFIVALLRTAKLRGLADAVKKEALRAFPRAYAGAVARVASRYVLASGYQDLRGAAEVTGDPRYGHGPSEVWYVKPDAARDLSMGSEFALRHGIALPDPNRLFPTHKFLGQVAETNPSEIFQMMQGEVWSPNGEARPLTGPIGHTSMMVGDIMLVNGRTLMVDRRGFYDLTRQAKVAFNKYNAPELVSQLLAVLESEGLLDALNQLRMKKVPELVDRAWAARGRTAGELRAAVEHLAKQG